MTTKAAFLDLNGTLTLPVRVNRLAEHAIIPGAIEAVRLLNQHGFVCPYVCPHRPRDGCACYKPQTHLYQHAAAAHGITIERSVVIGDTSGDLRAARALGCPGCLVRTGWGTAALRDHDAAQFADHIADDVLAAARWVTAHAAL